MYSQDTYLNNLYTMMQKVTPEIRKKMEDSGKPIIRITYEELKNAKFLNGEEVKKLLLNNKK